MKSKNKFIKRTLIYLMILSLATDCVKDPPDVVPDVPVNVTIELYHYNLLPGSSLVVTNQMVAALSLGYDNNGIIIYRDVDEFYAYDRTCPYHIEKSTAVEITAENPLYAKCPKCGSLYQLWFSGFPSDEGPSDYPLKNYHTTYFPNSNTLQIYN